MLLSGVSSGYGRNFLHILRPDGETVYSVEFLLRRINRKYLDSSSDTHFVCRWSVVLLGFLHCDWLDNLNVVVEGPVVQN